MKSLPARPSLESLRKQAKKLARDIAAGDAAGLARARVHLPKIDASITQRNAQLVIAREYGYAGWQDLIAEVSKRLGKGLEWAIAQARRIIHDNDVAGLKQLLAEYPALLSWQSEDGQDSVLKFATSSFGDSFDPQREQTFTRPACAELLIDAGAVVTPAVCDGIIESRARALLDLLRRKGVMPRTLRFYAAIGDIDAVRASVDTEEADLRAVNDAFVCACRFRHEAVASVLLNELIALDPELGKHIDGSGGRDSFIRYFIEERALDFRNALVDDAWRAFLMKKIMRTVDDGDLAEFVSQLKREPSLLGEAHVTFQVQLIERATIRDRADFIMALLDLDPALRRCQPPPPSKAIEFALTYAKLHLVPILTRIWPLPDDLPHAAAMGNLTQVRKWFDESESSVLSDPDKHFPYNSQTLMDYQWSTSHAQTVLDSALAWSVINRHFAVADYLLEHGADINTRWGSHEPASIMHELVGQVGTGENPANYESMQFLIDRGIDLTIEDYRWNATAEGWARHAARDEKLAQWLAKREVNYRVKTTS